MLIFPYTPLYTNQTPKSRSPNIKTLMTDTKILQIMQIEIKYIKKKLEEMPTRDEMELANRKLLEEVFTKCDERYASKLTQKIVYGLVALIITAMAVGGIALIIR